MQSFKFNTQFRFTINAKLLIFILLTTSVVYISSLGYISVRFKNQAIRNAIEAADNTVNFYASFVSAELNKDLEVTRTLSSTFYTLSSIPYPARSELIDKIIFEVIKNNSDYIAIFEQWELSNIIPNYPNNYGRFRRSYYRGNDGIYRKLDTLDIEGDDTLGIYYHVKQNKNEIILNPYFYSYSRHKELPSPYPKTYDAILETTIIVPIVDSGKFIGLCGLDIPLIRFQEMIDSIKPFKNSYAFLLSNNGSIVAHPEYNTLKLKNISNIFVNDDSEYHILQKIQSGKAFSYFKTDSLSGKQSYITYSPIFIGKTHLPWSFGMSVPVDVVYEDANKHFALSVLFGLLGLLLLSIIITFISRSIIRPLTHTTQLLNKLALGIIAPEGKLKVRTNDEIGKMAESANTLIDGLNKTIGFARQIGQGNLDVKYSFLSEYDVLGNALVEMQANLKASKQKIEHQRDELEHLNATKDKFFSIIAHDLRNPFTVLLSITQELASDFDKIPDDEMLFYLQKVFDSSKRLYNLLENLLDWSRSQTGRIGYNPELINLAEMLESETQLLRLQSDKKNITIRLEIDKRCKGWADKNMIQTVLRNLMTNAIKFTNQGGVVLVKSVCEADHVAISVRDNGIGMNTEDIKKLFRLDIKTKSIGTSKEKGTGLGLILCKEFIERNGGSISVVSEENIGTEFSFTIPIFETPISHI